MKKTWLPSTKFRVSGWADFDKIKKKKDNAWKPVLFNRDDLTKRTQRRKQTARGCHQTQILLINSLKGLRKVTNGWFFDRSVYNAVNRQVIKLYSLNNTEEKIRNTTKWTKHSVICNSCDQNVTKISTWQYASFL